MLLGVLTLGLGQAAMGMDRSTNAPRESGAAVAPLIISGRQSSRPAGTYSTGISEIIRLLDAKVDAPVVLAFIRNSPVAYNPDATELIALKKHGASTEVLTALLHHGDELWLQMAEAQAQREGNPPPAEPELLYCPKCAVEVSDPLTCGDCSAVICRRCGTPLESADELGMGD